MIREDIVEVVVSEAEAMALFSEEERRRQTGERMLVTWFEEIHDFSPEEIEAAEQFHVWVRRAHPNLLPTHDDQIPSCPTCGLAEQAELGLIMRLRKLPSDLIRSSNGNWYCSQRLARRITEESATGFVLTPCFFNQARRDAFLMSYGLERIFRYSLIPCDQPVSPPFVLLRPEDAVKADLWQLVPTALPIKISSMTRVGSLPTALGSQPSACGHTLGQRLLEPPILLGRSGPSPDFSFSVNAIGLPRGNSVWRPARQLVVSKRIARVLNEHVVNDFWLEPANVERS